MVDDESDARSYVKLGFLCSIISMRGAKLTFRDGAHLWVVLAGAAPRAWRLKVDQRGNAVGKWSERRPPIQELLHLPEVINAHRERLKAGILSEAALMRAEGQGPSNLDFIHQRHAIRASMKLRWLEQWLAHFPREALLFLFRHRFEERHWHLLNLWLRVPQGRELFDDIPALAWMLASAWCYKLKPVQRPLRSIRALIARPRRHVLRWLDLPEGAGTLRLLKHFTGNMLNMRSMHAVCRILRDNIQRHRWLSLHRPPDYQQLCILAYDQPISLDLLRAMNEGLACGPENARMPLAQTYGDTLKLLRDEHDLERGEELRRIRSPERLRQYHDELVRRRRLRLAIEGHAGQPRFDLASPLEAPPWLSPLDNSESLMEEAAEMIHCVDTYAEGIAQGRCYLYAVHHPLARATLCICPLGGGRWFLTEMRGKNNATISNAVRDDVCEWLRAVTQLPGYAQELRRLSSRWNAGLDGLKDGNYLPPAGPYGEDDWDDPDMEAPPRMLHHDPNQLMFDFAMPAVDSLDDDVPF